MSGRDVAACFLAVVSVMSVAGTLAAFRTWFRHPEMSGAVVFLPGPSVTGLLYAAIGWTWRLFFGGKVS